MKEMTEIDITFVKNPMKQMSAFVHVRIRHPMTRLHFSFFRASVIRTQTLQSGVRSFTTLGSFQRDGVCFHFSIPQSRLEEKAAI
jgi:hypothetical protein